ncbi:hypothetical protein LUZ63_000517 [Rhynchospora breviuscula]|uniref:KIB1-4 beta-propeller domain-containing protein n=1 Tax=Rhynchospora breviuscula TaxID=2022672 RepID=A0A9Q0HWZ0_9POAL|nr:hypothetical protein LUZ63_000517 [Rhynchospora breviuscula]
MESNESQERDWSSLPPDLLNLIAKKVGEITNFVRFRAVCTSWCSSTPVSDLPPQFPWIFRDHITPGDLTVSFYSIPLDKFYNFHAPNSSVKEFMSKEFKGPSEGYIYMVSHFFHQNHHKNELNLQVTTTSSRQRNLKSVFANIWAILVTGSQLNRSVQSSFQNTFHYSSPGSLISQLSLFNPLNNHEFILPAYDFGKLPCYFRAWKNQLQEYVIYYGNYGCPHNKLVSWRLGQANWCQVNLDSNNVYYDYFFLKGMLFSVKRDTGIIKVTDIGTGTLVSVLPSIEGYSNYIRGYLVEASGDILRVIRNRDQHPLPLTSELFEVYRLDENKNGSPCWVKVRSIGDYALFIDLNHALILKANDLAMIKRNSIYFMRRVDMNCGTFYDVKRMNIDTGAVEYLARDLSGSPQWFVPNLHHL